jgi:hypothetical protein
VENFKTYYESFSLNPLNWFKSKVKAQEKDIQKRYIAHARENFKKMKDLLKSKGYYIHKHEFSYTVRQGKMVGLSGKKYGGYTGKVGSGPLDKKYIQTLFTLAHEVGHVLQWNDATERKLMADTFKQELEKTNDLEHYHFLVSMHQLWYEINAWEEGLQFIPDELKFYYLSYAVPALTSYMKYDLQEYSRYELIQEPLAKLMAERRRLTPTK